MSAILSQVLPHLGAALILVCTTVALMRAAGTALKVRQVAAPVLLLLLLIPLGPYNLTHFVRVFVGDLSITALIVLSILLIDGLTGRHLLPRKALLEVAVVLVATALVLYPTALGLTYFDLYRFGYHPVVLGPVLFVVFAATAWSGRVLAPTLLGAGFVAFSLGFLESDNLWDYLLDPVICIYCLYLVIRHRRELPAFRFNQQQIEVFATITVVTFLGFSIYLAKFNPDVFRFEFTVEDGFVEWCSVLVLFCTMIVCAKRCWTLRRVRPPVFLTVTALLTLLCLFGAGEEISWGQRVFGLETPDYLKERNAQGELGLHNLMVEINGEKVKINKLVFGTGLALALAIYLFVATPLYRHYPSVRRFFNNIAAPMPRNYQIVGYLFVVATVELLVDSSKRGEMTEFAGSIVFALNVIYPYNPEIFNPEREL